MVDQNILNIRERWMRIYNLKLKELEHSNVVTKDARREIKRKLCPVCNETCIAVMNVKNKVGK